MMVDNLHLFRRENVKIDEDLTTSSFLFLIHDSTYWSCENKYKFLFQASQKSRELLEAIWLVGDISRLEGYSDQTWSQMKKNDLAESTALFLIYHLSYNNASKEKNHVLIPNQTPRTPTTLH